MTPKWTSDSPGSAMNEPEVSFELREMNPDAWSESFDPDSDWYLNVIFVDTFWLIARLMESTYVCLGEHPLHSGS